MNKNWEKAVISRVVNAAFSTLTVAFLIIASSKQMVGQACGTQNWAAATPNIWAATVSDLVMLNNDPTTNQPTIPTMLYDGTYSPWGYSQHPQAVTQLNTNWSCPSGTPVISIAGAGRETVSFQLFITAPAATTLSDVSVTITPLSGSGATLSSDNTGTSQVTRYLEGYVPYSCTGATTLGCVQASGSIPDPLIPFYDPYDSGNPAVATPFNVQQGTTQGVWVNISIPANQAAGAYTGSLTVSGTGITATTIPVNVTVWNGNLPAFDAGSTNASYADMLKVWLPLYQSSLDAGEGISGSDIPLFQKYQVMAHNYDIDTQFDPFAPSNSGAYPATNPTSFTTDGTTSSIDWTTYDSYFGPSLTPGGLFSDGTAMRVLDGPIANGGAGAWNYPPGYSWCMWNCGNAPLMPAGLVSLTQNYATQTSQHFSSNHTAKNWAIPDLMSYTFDENYNTHSYQLGDQPLMYQIMSQVMQAINASNSSLSPTWAASTAPMRVLTTDEPACMEQGDTPYYTDSACADHINLSYPGGALATPGYSTSWVTTWSPNPSIYMTGQPGPPLSYGWTVPPVILTGTGYQYTLDLTQGVPALSTAPAPIERWTYNNGGGGAGGIYRRVTYWQAYKYGQDVTVPSVGDPHPATPAPGGVWSWIGNYWGGGNGTPSPSSCNSFSPFVTNGGDQGDTYFFPGNELGCYYTANPVGQTVLTANPAVNTSCASNNYSVCNGISGPIATRELEQWRRGYEDYEYLYLYGKQAGRAAAEAVVASVAAEGMADWEGYDWENIDGAWYEYGVFPPGTSYTGNCTDPNPINSPIFGNLPNGLPNGPTGQGSSGAALNYGACEGLWSPDPYAYESARIQLAEALGFAPATTPIVTGLSPSSGVNEGGTSVVITGADFTGVTAVEFGGVQATSFTVNSSTKITAIAPAGNGTVTVQVLGPGGVSASNPNDLFTNVSPVTVTALSPNQGLQVGGNAVSITGAYFTAGATVMFGTSLATNVVVVSSTLITCVAPAGIGSVDVTVTTSQGTSSTNPSDLYTYEPPPTVSSVSPSSGPLAGGTSVTVTGTGFSVTGLTVSFGASPATNVVVISDTSLTANSPKGSSTNGGIVDVTATTKNGTSPINGGDHFNYTSPVTVTALSVSTGPPAGGTQVIITGTDFTGATAVSFGGNAATFTVNTATQITATSPAGGGTVDVIVTNPPYSNEPASADLFSYSSALKGGVFATLPTTAVGSTSSSQNIQITLQSASAISSIAVPPTQNNAVEFNVGTVSGCSLSGSVNASGTVCTVPVTFSPQYPGIRMGTLTVNNAGTVVGTAGLAGNGQGPEASISPGALNMSIGGGVYGVTATPQPVTTAALSVSNNFSALAIDGAGNLYIADNINCLAYKANSLTNQIVAVAGNYAFASGAVTPSTTPEPALGSNTCPIAIAVDGAGNVFVADANIAVNTPTTGNSPFPGVVEEISAATGQIVVIAGNPTSSLTATTTPQPALNVAIQAVNSLATDAAGNLYISDFFNNLVEKVTPDGNIVVVAGGGSNGGVTTTPQPATSVSLNGPTGMVIDASGNLYISDQNIGVIEEVNSAGQIFSMAGGGGSTPGTTPQPALSVAFNAPGQLAVDGAGNLYIADILNNEIEQVNLAGQLVVVAGGGAIVPSSTVQSSLSASLGNIEGLEVDGAGNIYIADGQNIGGGDNMIEKVSSLAGPLKFPYTNVGSSSTSQTLTLANIGNQPLIVNSLSATTDYPLQNTGTCALTAQNGQTLPSGNSCSLTYVFTPTIGGVLDETATLTDNSLNSTKSQQAISLTGTAEGGPAAAPTFSPAAGTYTSTQSVTIVDATQGASIYYTTNGIAPTTSSTLYTAAINVASTETLEAIATASGYTTSAVTSAVFTITPPPAVAPLVTVTLSPTSITTAQALTATVGVSGGTGSPTATGSVTLTSSAFTSVAATLNSGSAQIAVPAGSLPVGTDSLTVTYTPDSNSSSTYLSATDSLPITVTNAVPPSFTISGVAISIDHGATTGNTSVITTTPVGGFTGTINLSCAITPVAANDPPTCTITPSVTISGSTAQTATLTVNSTGARASVDQTNKLFWRSAGGATLAMMLLFGMPARRRRWQSMVGILVLLFSITCGVFGCGSGNPGTTVGTYTITVTGTSGATTETGSVSLSVQ